MEIVKLSNCVRTNWSGGSTTELFISPANGNYTTRDFVFRISMATVDEEETTYTPLPGFERTLLVLQGSISLLFEGENQVKLTRGYSQQFDGNLTTRCLGKAVNFNVMTNKNARCLTLELHEHVSELNFNIKDGQTLFFFVEKGKVEAIITNNSVEIMENELALTSTKQNVKLFLASETSVVSGILEL